MRLCGKLAPVKFVSRSLSILTKQRLGYWWRVETPLFLSRCEEEEAPYPAGGVPGRGQVRLIAWHVHSCYFFSLHVLAQNEHREGLAVVFNGSTLN